MILDYVKARFKRSSHPLAIQTSSLPSHDWRIEHAAAKLSILEQSIQDALQFLKKNHKSFFYRHKLPWYLVLGTEGAGKTSLLGMSNLGLVSTNDQPLNLPHATAYCDWLFGKEAVFIDVSGALMLPEDPKNDSHLIWKKFIELLHRYRRHYRLADGLMICIDLHDFLGKNRGQRQLQIDVLRHRIQSLVKYLKSLPVYLLFTKCDRIAGFTDSFNALSPEDCQQAFGISLPLGMMQQNLAPFLEEQLNLFLRRLNEQLISRLHQEHNLEKRSRIKDFPLQLEAQKRDIINLATQLHSTKTSLGGIYFTSSQQDGIFTDGLSPLLYSFGLPAIPQISYQPQQRPFFIQQPLQKIIRNKLSIVKNIPAYLNWNNKHFYKAWGGLLAIVCLVLVPGYFYNARTLNSARNIMGQYQLPTAANSTPQQFLPSLNVLRKAVDATTRHSNPLLTLAFHQARALRSNLQNTYIEALNSQFAPLLKQTLEQQLQAATNVKPQEYFDALKAYLMLEDSAHFDANFVSQWFADYWQKTLTNNPEQQKQLNAHLAFWLKQQPVNLATDPQIVQLARQRLNSLPLSELTYVTLQESYKSTTNPERQTPSTDNPSFPIPPETEPMYLADNFTSIYQDKIPQLVQHIATGDNWVLNLTLPANITDALTEQLITSVRHLYVQRFAEFWMGELLNIQPGEFSSLAQARAFAASLNTNDSSLIPLLTLAADNLKPLAAYPEATPTLQALQQLQKMLQGSDQNRDVQKALNNLTAYLDNILQAKDSGEAALNAAKHRMHTEGKDDAISQLYMAARIAPAPLNNWLTSLGQNTWRAILETATSHINLLWLTQVMPDYNEHIKNQYPVFSNAEEETSLAQFSQFFGPDGTVDQFLKQHLSAFIDNSQLYWKWKYTEGLTLNISQKSLEMLNRAALIQKMYFSGTQKNPGVGFSIMPSDSGLMATNYVLTVDGQTINYLSDFHQNRKVTWPKQGHATFALTQNANKTVFFEETGPWAVFRLLANGRLLSTRNSQVFQLIFNANGTPVSYELLADQPINPFIPMILSGFRCPEKL